MPKGTARTAVIKGRETAFPNANQNRSTPNVASIGIAMKTAPTALGAVGDAPEALSPK
jgi:hypothetical protein